MQLSVIIPAYNERHTIGPCLVKVVAAIPAVRKEIVIVDDCSRDGTRVCDIATRQLVCSAQPGQPALFGELLVPDGLTGPSPAVLWISGTGRIP